MQGILERLRIGKGKSEGHQLPVWVRSLAVEGSWTIEEVRTLKI